MADDPEARIAALEARVASFERAEALSNAVDARLERALRERQPLERVLPDLLALLATHLGATGAAVRTLDESLAERTFEHGSLRLTPAALEGASDGEARFDHDGARVVSRALDVAGEDFGAVFVSFSAEPPEDAGHRLARFCELLDNHLASVAQARRKFEVIRSVSDALKDPVLDRGIGEAIEILRRNIDFENLVLLFRHEDDLESGALRYKVYEGGALLHDSAVARDAEVDAFLRSSAAAFFTGDDEAVRARFGIRRYREEVLITGVRAARVVGRMLVTSRQGEFHTYDRELLDRFADYLRQRIVDFNREWKQLANIFSFEVCERLLNEEGYVGRYLTPRERDVAILYADIAGFTRVSEQVLKRPEAIGRLVDTWAEGAVEILWESGGVFDKMVGDCVIGLFGPPFFEATPREVTERALEAATRIRELTRALVGHPALPELASIPALDLAVGLNYCPLSVGLFGPDDDFTGFSSGMNNTARLQGIATGGQVLCMQSFVDAHGAAERFGEVSRATVKNVADPLLYRPLIR